MISLCLDFICPQSKDMQAQLIGNTKWPIGVNVSVKVWLS